MEGINNFFLSFDPAKSENRGEHKLLPNFEMIIKESLKINIEDRRLEQLKQEYVQQQDLIKIMQREKTNLKKVRQQAMQKIVEQEEEKVQLEDYDDQQEEQQAKSSDIQKVSSEAHDSNVAASRYLPQIVAYDKRSRQSKRVSPNEGTSKQGKGDSASGKDSGDEFKLPPINQKRDYMIFASLGAKEFEKSLTIKQSSDNISVSQSIAESELHLKDLARKMPS